MENSIPDTIRVLIVDDDEDAFGLIRRLLMKVPEKRFTVDWASSYEEGLEAIQKQGHDVYLVDYRLGMETGLNLLKTARSRGAQGPIIILTGADDPRVDYEAAKMGASDFLLKDKLDSATLERSIRYSIQHYATLQALQKSNERFRLLFERSMDAIFISNDLGDFLEVNGAACKLLGHSREELLAMNLSDLLSTDTHNVTDPLQEQSFGELSFTGADGERRFAEFSASRLATNLNLSILRDITERRKLETEIQEISEREQRRLGQDLHDGLGQVLTGISFLSKVLQQKLASKGYEESTDAGNIVSQISQALSQARELARGLCPVVLEENDISAALQQLCNNIENFFGVTTGLECDPELKLQDNALAIHLYRIAQEATTNALRHGHATEISIQLATEGRFATLRVEDNGIGIPEKMVGKGMGLRVMQHRARMIGANLEIERGPHGGTIVTCAVGKRIAFKPAAAG
jgi:PAS domain S-box-containing protein